MGAKQDPTEKQKRALAADGKCYFSYANIAATISGTVPQVEAFKPDVFVAIGGGGFIPARMLRTEVKKPILAVSLELYDDATKTANSTVLRKQWFEETPGTFGALVRGKRVLIVDEVDDTRATLQYAVEELVKLNAPAAVGVLVVHNKLKAKKGVLPESVTYIAGEGASQSTCLAPPHGDALTHSPALLLTMIVSRRPRAQMSQTAGIVILGTPRPTAATSTHTRSSPARARVSGRSAHCSRSRRSWAQRRARRLWPCSVDREGKLAAARGCPAALALSLCDIFI